MIRLGNSARFTPHEVGEFRQVELDMGNVRHQKDIEQEVIRWTHILADERFDLLEKIALEMAKANAAKVPPRLTVIQHRTTGQPHRCLCDCRQKRSSAGLLALALRCIRLLR